jgi:hypothetical protein
MPLSLADVIVTFRPARRRWQESYGSHQFLITGYDCTGGKQYVCFCNIDTWSPARPYAMLERRPFSYCGGNDRWRWWLTERIEAVP